MTFFYPEMMSRIFHMKLQYQQMNDDSVKSAQHMAILERNRQFQYVENSHKAYDY